MNDDISYNFVCFSCAGKRYSISRQQVVSFKIFVRLRHERLIRTGLKLKGQQNVLLPRCHGATVAEVLSYVLRPSCIFHILTICYTLQRCVDWIMTISWMWSMIGNGMFRKPVLMSIFSNIFVWYFPRPYIDKFILITLDIKSTFLNAFSLVGIELAF